MLCVSRRVLQKTIPYMLGLKSTMRRIASYVFFAFTTYNSCVTLEALMLRLPAEISLGSLRYFFVRCFMPSGIVALKHNVCLWSGVLSRMASNSSWKPMLSISSASSKTRNCTSSIRNFLRWMRSKVRPGVPTTICGRPCSSLICFVMGAPP